METPFKFLTAYSKNDQWLYFGREAETEELYDLVRRSNFIVVLGRTGVGKTSLIRCGLLNKLSPLEAFPLTIRRQNDINTSLKETLVQALKKEEVSASSTTDLIVALYGKYFRPVYLIFDQFEELFILGNDGESKQFFDTIEKIRSQNIPCVITLVLRGEYFDRLMDLKKSVPYIFDFSIKIFPIDPDKCIGIVDEMFKALIEKGCTLTNGDTKHYKIDYDPGMTKDVIRIVSDNSNNIELSHLQVYLDRLFRIAYENSEDEIIRFHSKLLEDARIDNIKTVIDSLLDQQIVVANEKIGETSNAKVLSFLKLFVSDANTKQPITYAALRSKTLSMGFRQKQLDECLDVFTNARIILVTHDNQYELAHDSIATKIAFMRPDNRLTPLIEGNPYKGLEAFGERPEDIKRFFGRSESIEKILTLLDKNPLVVICGTSGIGKSSLIKAGVFPELRSRHTMFIQEMRPGDYPLLAFRNAIDKFNSRDNNAVFNLLLIDQYEELITRGKREGEGYQFVQALLELLTDKTKFIARKDPYELRIVITVRADFEPQFKEGPLEKYWDKGRFVVPLMTARELEQVIQKPAELAACNFDPPTLIADIAEEVAGRPGSLPLLSFALSLMYEKSLPARTITKQIYKDVGVFGALQRKADEIFAQLKPLEQLAMREVLLRMVSLDGSEIASRKVDFKELDYPDSERKAAVDKVVAVLVENRLILRQVDENGAPYIEPAHDALLRGWSLLRQWVNQSGQETIFFRERLDAAVFEWHRLDRHSDALWTDDVRIAGLPKQQNEETLWMNTDEREFVTACLEQWKTQKNKKRKNQLIARLGVWAAGISIVLGMLSVYAVKKAKQAQASLKISQKQKDLADSISKQVKNANEILQRLKKESDSNSRNIVMEFMLAKKAKDSAEVLKRKAEIAAFKARRTADSLRLAKDKLVKLAAEGDIILDKQRNSIKLYEDSLRVKRAEFTDITNKLKEIKRSRDSIAEISESKTETIQKLTQSANTFAPYEEVARSSAQIKNYQTSLSKITNYRALWPPSYQLKPGDIGRFVGGEFRVESNLSSFNITIQIESDHLAAINYTQKGITVSPEGGICTVAFPANSFLVRVANPILKRLSNLNVIADSVNRLFRNGSWNKDWLIVTELVETNNGIVMVAGERGDGQLVMQSKSFYQSTNPEIPTDFSILKNKNIPIVLTGHLTLFFKPLGLNSQSKAIKTID